MKTILAFVMFLMSSVALACGPTDPCAPDYSGWGQFVIDSGTYAYGGGNAGDIFVGNKVGWNVNADYEGVAAFTFEGMGLGQNTNIDGQHYVESGAGGWGSFHFAIDGTPDACLFGCN